VNVFNTYDHLNPGEPTQDIPTARKSVTADILDIHALRGHLLKTKFGIQHCRDSFALIWFRFFSTLCNHLLAVRGKACA